MCLLLLLFEVPASFRCHLGFVWQVRHSVDSCITAPFFDKCATRWTAASLQPLPKTLTWTSFLDLFYVNQRKAGIFSK